MPLRDRYNDEPSSTRLLYASTAVSTSVENSAIETTFDNASVSVHGPDLRVGDVLEVIASVWIEDQNSTNTQTLKLYINTQEIWSSGAIIVADNDVGYVHAFITITATGAGGYVSAQGVGILGTAASAIPFWTDAVAESLAATLDVKLTIRCSIKAADNKATCKSFVVLRHTMDNR